MATFPPTPPNVDSASNSAPTFESALAELEGIVAAMEAGQMPLQDALDAYQRGSALLRQCQATLTAAEQKIRVLDADGLHALDASRDASLADSRTSGEQES